ncbi:hypothetical protein CTA2_8054 [Colletotrichum tanaceti]|uniref:CCHC-type domain-containing protein n=1 Tax=Colletotrichum tanaceti TaxID=1306861 RepID=A0A4U6XJU8_9PEZI|nr:hypothetical protein CTA2_8054 [Colletotrichum tanaceti]TKW54457.1 hypothetical protein CTA1_10765 [Colletotrichum tanaceti]
MQATREKDPDETYAVSGTDNRRRQEDEEEGVEETHCQSRGDTVGRPNVMSAVVSAVQSARHQLAVSGSDMKLTYSNMTFDTMRTEHMVAQATRDYDTFGRDYTFVDTFRYYRNESGDHMAQLAAEEEDLAMEAHLARTAAANHNSTPDTPPRDCGPWSDRRNQSSPYRRDMRLRRLSTLSNAASNSGALTIGKLGKYDVKMATAGTQGRHYDFANQRVVPPWHGIVNMSRAYQERLQIQFGPVFEGRRTRFNAANTCAKCGHIGHWLSDCAFPDDSGFIYGCPIHNSRSHSLDDCPDFHRLSESQLLWLLVVLRGNKPPIRTTISWSKYLRIAIEEGTWTSDNVPLPLTSTFVLDMVLGPKSRHSWLDFDYATQDNDQLPSDPVTRGPHAEVVKNTALDNEVHVPLTHGSLKKKGRAGAAVRSDAPSYADDGDAPQEDNYQEEESHATLEAEAEGDVGVMDEPEVDNPGASVQDMITQHYATEAHAAEEQTKIDSNMLSDVFGKNREEEDSMDWGHSDAE